MSPIQGGKEIANILCDEFKRHIQDIQDTFMLKGLRKEFGKLSLEREREDRWEGAGPLMSL